MSLNPFAPPPGLTPPRPPRSTQPSQANVSRNALAVAVRDLNRSFLRTPSAAPPPPPPLPSRSFTPGAVGAGTPLDKARAPAKTSADTAPAATPDEVADLVDAAEDAAASMSDPGVTGRAILPTIIPPTDPGELPSRGDPATWGPWPGHPDERPADLQQGEPAVAGISESGVSKLIVGAGIVLAGIVVIRLIK
jgi:hypothetical protein